MDLADKVVHANQQARRKSGQDIMRSYFTKSDSSPAETALTVSRTEGTPTPLLAC
jgi:hypothetical protein